MQRILFFISLFLTSLFAHAQSSGFMGKRISVGYGINMSPALMGANSENESIIGSTGSAETWVPAFNIIHEGFLDYTISSKWIMGFSVRYYKTAYDNAMSLKQIYTNTYQTTAERPSGYYNINGLTYTLAFKFYGRHYVAPWGRYIMFGPALNTAKTEYSPTKMSVEGVIISNNLYGRDTSISDFGSKTQMHKGFNIMMGYGRSRIIRNRITFDYGANIHLFSLLSTLFDISSNGEENILLNQEVYSTNYIRHTVKRRIRGVNRMNVFLKIGILLF